MKNSLFSVGRLALFPLMTLACTGEDDASPEPADANAPECRRDEDCPVIPNVQLYCEVSDPRIEEDNTCVECLSAVSRDETVIDVGCPGGSECIDGRCVATFATACVDTVSADLPNPDAPPTPTTIDSGCTDRRPFCVLGVCAECEEASNCPFFGDEDTCFAVRCNLGWCSAENVCTCESSVECNDGEDCTQDVCEAGRQECVHTPLSNCETAAAPPAGGGGGGGTPPPPADTGSITVTWTVASGTFSNATLSAQIAGGPMLPRNTQANASSITGTIAGVPRGATVDVSIEYTQGGGTSNSCVMSSGTLSPNGTMTATATTGTPTAFTQVSNGVGGCNRRTTMP